MKFSVKIERINNIGLLMDYHWVLLGFDGFYKVLLDFNMFYQVLLGFTGFC